MLLLIIYLPLFIHRQRLQDFCTGRIKKQKISGLRCNFTTFLKIKIRHLEMCEYYEFLNYKFLKEPLEI